MNGAKQSTGVGKAWRLGLEAPGFAARLPIPLIFSAMLALWFVDSQTVYEQPLLLFALNLVFTTLLSAGIVVLVVRSFLISGKPGLLLLGCGAFFFAAGGAMTAIVASVTRTSFDPNMQVTVHNTGIWISALCHLAGAAFTLRWPDSHVMRPRLWLATAAMLALVVTGYIVFAAAAAHLPIFFSTEAGPSPERQLLLASSIAMFLLTATMLRRQAGPQSGTFFAWYSLALQLLALGLFGLILQPSVGSLSGWLSRLTLYLGGGCMVVAALATRSISLHRAFLPTTRLSPLYAYGVATLLPIAAAVLRLVFMSGLGTSVFYLPFFPAIVLAALYGGVRAGLLASVVSLVLADYFWVGAQGGIGHESAADLLAMAIFLGSAALISSIAGGMNRALLHTEAAKIELRRLNRALRLVGDCNIALVQARQQSELLERLCRLVVDSGGYLMAWVGVAAQDAAKSVRVLARSGHEDAYLDHIGVSWDAGQDIGQGPTGTALRTGVTQIVADCPRSPIMLPWRKAVLRCGFQSCVALPLFINGRVFAALTLYAHEGDEFDPVEVQLLEELASNISFGLESLRAQDELDRHRNHLEQLVTARSSEIIYLNSQLEARVADAESANRAKRNFLATMSHELRTPLNAVVGLAGLLADSSADRLQRDYANKIQLAAEALRGLIDDILDFSRIEAGALTLEQVTFSLDTILRTVAGIVSVSARDKPIEILFDLAPDLPQAFVGDPLRLQQVLMNLLGNAVKFTEAGEIVVTVSCPVREDGQVNLRVAVEDTGIGIAPADTEKIFEGFAQADTSVSRRFGGSGLGLAISANLVKLMGGQIGVKSTVGQGSVFHWSMPLRPAALETRAPALSLPPQLRLLIVDDHRRSRQTLQKACTGLAWQATIVDGAAAGLKELQRSAAAGQDYDLMLLDWHMPGMDGIEMLRAAYAAPDIALPLVILMAPGCELEQAVVAGEDVYLDGVIAKPILPSTLLDAVRGAYFGDAAETLPVAGAADRRLAGKRLLVVEDNRLNQLVIEQILTRAGAEIAIAADGLEAVNTLHDQGKGFDAVLMDIQMPVMDGYTATRIIRDEMGLVDLPIIAVTANATTDDREKSRLAGMAGLIAKPIDVEDLLDLLTGRRARRASSGPGPLAAVAGTGDHLPGLDVNAALPIFGGNRQAYGKALRDFITQHGGDVDEAHRIFTAGDLPAAARLIHDVCGVTGFLRATEVFRVTGRLELALRKGDAQAAGPLFDDLRVAIDTLTASIDQLDRMTVGG